jgi:hypothetical protein
VSQRHAFRAGLDTEARGRILCLCQGSNPGHPVCSQKSKMKIKRVCNSVKHEKVTLFPEQNTSNSESGVANLNSKNCSTSPLQQLGAPCTVVPMSAFIRGRLPPYSVTTHRVKNRLSAPVHVTHVEPSQLSYSFQIPRLGSREIQMFIQHTASLHVDYKK